jgi:2-polyprenyl-3-methyl-5-hydroxy-6-metoxy-1,4-benzoquinol methylase/uncharacterized protein YbaR (Trm112 family)
MIDCPVCESQKFESLFALKGSDVVRCSDCDTVYVPSPLPEVTNLYQSQYFSSKEGGQGYIDYAGEFQAHAKVFHRRFEKIEALKGGTGLVLEVGCALGHAGAVAQKRGWDVVVTDISEFAVQKATTDFNLKGFVSPTGKVPVRANTFDVITAFDVIEHLSHPKEFLRSLHGALRGHGLLHISTPDVGSLSARIMGRHWYHLKPDEHLVYFNRSSLKTLLENCGFEILKMESSRKTLTLRGVLQRLRRYAKAAVDVSLKIFEVVGLADKEVSFLSGEVEVIARKLLPATTPTEARPTRCGSEGILDVVVCANCEGPLKQVSEAEIDCQSCDSTFEFDEGVVNLSRYAKRSLRKAVGRLS